MFPPFPEFDPELVARCRADGDFAPILYEWYKYVGGCCVVAASIQPESPALRAIPPRNYSVLVGLLIRCARLMLANTRLSSDGSFGESTAILDRSIFESSVKLRWLCDTNRQENFDRYVAEGLKTEVELKKRLNEAIAKRGGVVLAIEARMLQSVDRYIATSGQSEQQILDSPPLPKLPRILEELGEEGRMMYVIGQRIGSHHVHGTWPSLLLHYLDDGEGGFYKPRDHNCPTYPQQYSFGCFMVLAALMAHFNHVLEDRDAFRDVLDFLHSVEEKILEVQRADAGEDFDPVAGAD